MTDILCTIHIRHCGWGSQSSLPFCLITDRVLLVKMAALDHPALLELEDSLVSWDSLDPRVLL